MASYFELTDLPDAPRSGPVLSQAALASHESFRNDMKRAEAQPGGIAALPESKREWYAKMASNIASAEATTGQQPSTVQDPRTPQQQYWDRSTELNKTIRASFASDLAGLPPDPVAVCAAVEKSGKRTYLDCLILARQVCNQPEMLSALNLIHASDHVLHLRRLPPRPV